jgi:hypothetical protein
MLVVPNFQRPIGRVSITPVSATAILVKMALFIAPCSITFLFDLLSQPLAVGDQLWPVYVSARDHG